MKHLYSRVFSCCLAVILMTGLLGVSAAGSAYPDIDGHWAEEVMSRAVADGYLRGSDGLLRPDDPITGAELVTVITRIFSAADTADLSDVADINKDDWYYEAASKAVAMGIIAPADGELGLSEAIPRKRAFLILAEAFQLVEAGQDTSVLSRFADAELLSGVYRPAAAAMVSAGYIRGYDGQLHINNSITRAEFITVLYSIVPNIQAKETSGKFALTADGGTLLTEGPASEYNQYPGAIYIGGGDEDVSLKNVRAATAVLRCGRITSLDLNGARIGRLVIAAGRGDLSIYPDASSEISVISVGAGQGRVVLGGSLNDVEITGSNRTVMLTGDVQNLRVSGSGNTIIIDKKATVSNLTVYHTGTGNTVTLEGSVLSCGLYGKNTVVSGGGAIESLTDNSSGSDITAAVTAKTVNVDYGLDGVTLQLSAPDTLPPEQPLEASVTVATPSEGKVCRGSWYLDGRYVGGGDLTLGVSRVSSLTLDIPRTAQVPVTANLTFILSHTSADGAWHDLVAEKTILIEPIPPEPRYTAQEVLNMVTTGYQGNYTLAWAEENDYTPELKEEFVNLKGYTSKTPWLVWISITYQRVNIFTGSAGEWKLDKTFIIGSGAAGNDTPVGVFSIIGRHTRGWTTKEYTVKPVINFINAAYGFHSRLYYPNSTELRDERIGFPVSHGCIRMYDEDVAWMYDNLPDKTTVVVW